MGVQGLIRRLETSHPEGLTQTEMFLANEDLMPVTEDKKTWDSWNFVSGLLRASSRDGACKCPVSCDVHAKRRARANRQVGFWIADSFNLNTFVIASGMISAGLNWWQALICVIVGYSLVGPLIVLNARPGAMRGLIFPAVCRTTFGIFGSLWPVFNRESLDRKPLSKH